MIIRIAVAAFWLCAIFAVIGGVLPKDGPWIAVIIFVNPIAAIPGFVSGWRNEWRTVFPVALIVGSVHVVVFFVMYSSVAPGLIAAILGAAVTVVWAGIGIKAHQLYLRRHRATNPSAPSTLQIDEAEIPY